MCTVEKTYKIGQNRPKLAG